jgi:ABC-2 type transport system permease protein
VSLGFAPGGIAWLLRHELRLAWYGAAMNGRGRRGRGNVALLAVLLGVAWIALHVACWALLDKLGPEGMDTPLLAMAATGALAGCATFMLSTALRASVLALFERGDLDLLLSSPLPSRTIFAVRLLGVAATTAALFLFLFAPLANVALVLGHPGWFGIDVAIVATAVLCACGGMLGTLALVRLIGARRTRVVAQVLAAIAGGVLFIVSQSFNYLAHAGSSGLMGALARAAQVVAHLGPGSAVWLPGRAAFGDPLGLLCMLGLAAAALVLTVARTHRFFAHGLQQAAGMSRTAERPPQALRLHMRSSLFDTIVIKEWRLIARDPQLISQVLLQCIYLLPLLFVILRNNAPFGPALAAGLALLCSSLTGGIAWIVIAAEDAPDLLHSSPAPLRTIRLAKLAAATMPTLFLVAAPLLWLVVRTPRAGLLACFTTCGAVLGAALIEFWAGRPAARSEFRTRGKESLLSTMLGLLNSICWGGLGWLLTTLLSDASLDYLLGAAGCLAGALVTLAIAWCVSVTPVPSGRKQQQPPK